MRVWCGTRPAAVVALVTSAALVPSTATAALPTPQVAHGAVTGSMFASSVTGHPAQTAAVFPLNDRRVEAVLGAAAEDVSFSVKDRVSGKTYTYNAGLRNCTGSIVKVLVLATLIRERRDDGKGLTSSQRALAERMIRYSDNDATSSLLRQAGGSSAAQRMARDLGMSRTTVMGAWGRTTTSAADERLLMDRLIDGTPELSTRDRRYILGLMGRVDPGQRWGVGDVPKGQNVAVKNGWVPLSPRGWRVNSIGSVKGSGRDYTLAILSYDNRSMESGVRRVGQVSGLVWKALAPKGAAAVNSVGDSTVAVGAAAEGDSTPFWIRRGGVLPPHPFG